MHISQLTALDRLTFVLNDLALDRDTAKTYIDWNECWLVFDVSRSLRQGWNELTIAVEERNHKIAAPLTLQDVEVILRYR